MTPPPAQPSASPAAATTAPADQQTYRRATGAALLGLGTQLFFAVLMAVLGLYAQSGALHAAAWHLFGGVPIWLTLWLLYQQHRQEREEALEAEQLAAADARAAALFDEAGHNLASARKRLDSIYRWGLNVVSITVSIYLLTAGLALFFGHYNLIETTDQGRDFKIFSPPTSATPRSTPGCSWASPSSWPSSDSSWPAMSRA